MAYVEPGYKVPSRTHITKICRKKYDAMKEKLLASLSMASSVALTTDI